MRQVHRRFRALPFYIVGKEISLEDVRLGLEKMPDQFHEHPATVLIVTNLNYMEAAWLMPRSIQAPAALNWIEVPLRGGSSHEFDEQITDLQLRLAETWTVKPSEKTGNPLYTRLPVLVIYREDHKFLVDQVIPRPGRMSAAYDLVISSQLYRACMQVGFKVKKVLAPGGRLLGIHSSGGDPGLDIIQRILSDQLVSIRWPAGVQKRPYVRNPPPAVYASALVEVPENGSAVTGGVTIANQPHFLRNSGRAAFCLRSEVLAFFGSLLVIVTTPD